MSRVVSLLVIVTLCVGPAAASPCRNNTWQPTYVHDLINVDGVPYYVMPDGSFVPLTGDWASQSGPGMCCLFGVRDRTGFTSCFEYTRIQCGCDRQSLVNDTCRRFLAERGSTDGEAGGIPQGTWTTTYGTMTFGPITQGQRIRATYSAASRIAGALSGRTLDGVWVQPASGRRCATPYDGSFYWGRMRFEFAPDWRSFQGTWSYCDEPPGSSSWSGTRQ